MFSLAIKIAVRTRYASYMSMYRSQPIFKYLYHEGVKMWFPILLKNHGVKLWYGDYADEIMTLTFSGACPKNYLEEHMDNNPNLHGDDIKKDPVLVEKLEEMDPSGEIRKTLRYHYTSEEHKRKYGHKF